jgi:hypothetical protein
VKQLWWAVFFLPGCFATNWIANPGAFVTDQEVASALDDGLVDEKFDASSVPQVHPAEHVRPCCAFGMDLQMTINGGNLPGYTVSNIVGAGELGHHEYDNGMMTFNQDLGRLVTLEKNGLVFTCRGGFVDTAHVRDNADLTMFLATRLLIALPNPALITLEGDGAIRRVVLKAVPPELMARYGRLEVAILLAQYAAFQLSIWHELVTWYGFESYGGFSEKLSAFSPEDFYSNAIGLKIAAGILRNQRVRTRHEWDLLMDAWIPLSLTRLVALPPDLGRRAMKSVDGLWWDSSRRIPDWQLVTRRNYELGPQIVPWRLFDAELPDDPVIDTACNGRRKALVVTLPTQLGDLPLSELVAVDFEVGPWASRAFPFTDEKNRRVTSEAFPALTEQVRLDALKTLGVGFDHPGRRPQAVNH